MVTQLDPAQMMKLAFNETDSTFQVELGANSGIDLALDHSVDSISVVGVSSTTKVSLLAASSGVVLGPVSAVGMTTFMLYTNTTATTTGPGTIMLQVSPSDTDDVWFTTALTVAPNGTLGNVNASTVLSPLAARRARLSATISITGTYDVYMVMNGS